MANYTEKAIFRAFEELLEEKPFDKITVSAIVSKSEVSANTFYYHFQDIYDLLDKWLDRKKNQFFAMTQLTGSWTDRLKVLLHAMQENPKLVYHVSDSITRERLERYVFTSIESQFYDLIGEKTAAMEITDETRKMMTSFFCCSGRKWDNRNLEHCKQPGIWMPGCFFAERCTRSLIFPRNFPVFILNSN